MCKIFVQFELSRENEGTDRNIEGVGDSTKVMLSFRHKRKSRRPHDTRLLMIPFTLWSENFEEGGVRVCGDLVLRYFWCGFVVISILTRGIAVSIPVVCGY